MPGAFEVLHAKHHSKKVQRATEAMRLSVAEEVVDVSCSIAAVNLVQAHPLSRTIYNVVIVWLIIELHSGVRSLPLQTTQHLPCPCSRNLIWRQTLWLADPSEE